MDWQKLPWAGVQGFVEQLDSMEVGGVLARND